MRAPSFEELMLLEVDDLPASDVLFFIRCLVDLAFEQSDMSLREKGTQKALGWADSIGKLEMTDAERLDLDYFQAVAWHNRAGTAQTKKAAWAWDNEPLRHQILFSRRAVNNPAFANRAPALQCSILTNPANSLNTAGRFVEAQEYWNRALAIEPRFWMTLGNRGAGRIEYARVRTHNQ